MATPRDRWPDQFRGALLGLAAGDALGTTLEFTMPGAFTPITDLVGGGPFKLQPGQWTDDTSMALCLAESLVECQGFDPLDQMTRYLRWYEEGYLSSTGLCFDIGGTTLAALTHFALNREPYAGPTDERSAGNGSLMRLAPVALAFAANPELALARAADSSRTTHGAPQAVDCCRYYAGLLVGALHGVPKAELLRPGYSPVPGYWERQPLHPAVRQVLHDDWRTVPVSRIHGSGYVVKAMEAALWCFARTDDFRSGALAAANLGDDADTTAAIYGQLAGAWYGAAAIPAAWRAKLALHDRILALADGLHAYATR
jgi:ADP-ribosylglycohydrolase